MPRSYPASIELSKVLEEAHDIAREVGETLDSAHLLLAMFTTATRARDVLEDRGLSEDGIITELLRMADEQQRQEPLDTIPVINQKAAQLAESDHNRVITSLHFILALCRVNKSLAYRVIEGAGVKPSALRTAAFRALTGDKPRHRVATATLPSDRIDNVRGMDLMGEPEPAVQSAKKTAVAVALPEVESLPYSSALSSPIISPIFDEPEIMVGEEAASSRYELDPDTFPILTGLGRNLTVAADRGTLDKLVGRRKEIEQMIDILNRRRANNPCLVGDPGVGKTAIVEGLAQLIVASDPCIGALGEKIIVELDVGSILSGTHLRGSLSERIGLLKDEMSTAEGRIILFIDEIHSLVGAGAGDSSSLDAANELKAVLARGEFPCIGATTMHEYRKYFEVDPSLERRFQIVLAEPPSIDEAIEVVQGVAHYYSEHHKVKYRDEALDSAVRLSERWIHDKFLPAKAIGILDGAGSIASRHQKTYVSTHDVAEAVSQQVNVPVDRLLVSDAERLLAMPDYITKRVVAHDEVLNRICGVIQRNFAGFTSNRPMGSFLLLGPTGVGKTESAKVVAEFLFGSRDAMTRIDMSEYREPHSVSRLIGAPPGYVGHGEAGQLSEAVRRRPYQIILFDELEKAANEVLAVLLQLLEEGQITDGRGRKVRFQHTVVFMTSNLGQQHFGKKGRGIGFGSTSKPSVDDEVMADARRRITPELWNRIEEKMVFHPLEQHHVEQIAELLLEDSANRLYAERQIRFTTTSDVVPLLIERGGYDAEMGARPMRRKVAELVEGAVARSILRGLVSPGDTVSVGVKNGEIEVIH